MDLNRGWQQLGTELKKKIKKNRKRKSRGLVPSKEMTKINPAFYTLEV